ncbi:6-hydroxymethylpterin diphosphokinase MptE-like protein [Sporosarcina sp. 179-K 3D1 HS]|uniref:motility associated factor glycosyltransferase family protein n=1 Tax=Sporosarcina sp. 179-K 3D1 HS TaxID=3232169 RepID=UPI0039A19C0E
MDISLINTKTVPTVKVTYNGKTNIFHSKYNPENEADTWVINLSKVLKQNEDVLVIGLGAGYHIKKLALQYKSQKIIGIEFNDEYYSWFLNSIFYKQLSNLNNVDLFSFSRLSKKEQKQVFSPFSSTNIGIHKSGLDIFPSEYSSIFNLLKKLQYHQRTIYQQVESLYENFHKNISLNDPGIKDLKDTYSNRPMILVSAGPSLSKQLPLLKTIKEEGKITIGAVGTAIKPLLQAEVIPDFFMVSDPKVATLTQLSNIHIPEAKLLYLSTAFHETILLHSGERYIVYQHGFPEAEIRAKENKEPIIQTGGSVATSLLDTMVWLGAKSVALVGQDLAYTEGQSHAKGAHLQKNIIVTSNQLQVENYERNGLIFTSKNLSIYRDWFEKYAEEHHGLPLYNCTEGGAYVTNWRNISLQQYSNTFK